MPRKRQTTSKTTASKKTMPKKDSATTKQMISKTKRVAKKTQTKKVMKKAQPKRLVSRAKRIQQSFAQRISRPNHSTKKTSKRGSKKMHLSKFTDKLSNKNTAEMTVLIAKGSAAVAAAAGVVAAGAYMVDRSRRDKVSKKAQETMDRFQRVAGRFPEEMPETYRAVQHEILNPKTRKSSKVSKAKRSRGRKS